MKNFLYPRTFFVTLLLIVTTTLHAQSNGPFKCDIDSVQGFFFQGFSGTFSDNMLEDTTAHFNIIIENDPVEEMLVKVKVKYIDGDNKSQTWVQLVVKEEGGRVIVNRKINVPAMIRNDKTWTAAFMIYDIGCRKLDISAQLVGEATSAVVKKKVNFYCGE